MTAWLPLALALAVPSGPAALTFDEAIGLAGEAPDVRGALRAVEVKRASRRRTSPIVANPQLYLQPGYRVLARDIRGFEIQGAISQSWNLSGLSRARRASMADEEELWQAEARLVALGRSLAAARAWIDLWAAQQLLLEARAEAGIAATFTATVERAQALSAATMADVADARAYRSDADLLVLAVEGEVFHLGLLLARETGRLTGEPLAAAGDLPAPEIPPADAAAALDRAERLPEVATRAIAGKVAQAHAVEIRAAHGVGLMTGIYVQRDQPGGLVPYAMLGVTLPAFNRGERERGEALAAAERLAGEAEQARVAARVDVAMAIHEVEHTRKILAELEERLVPSLGESVSARERLFSAGHATVVEVLLARRQAIQARARRHRVAADHAWARVKLWLLLATIENHGGRG